MKKYIKLFVLVLAGMVTFFFAGCGGGFSEDDAATLVQGDLNSIYLNQQSDEYLKLCDLTKDEANSNYKDGMKSAADAFVSYFQFDESVMTDDTYNRVVALYEKIYAKAKFQVGDVTKSEDNYLVSVTIYPMDIFQKVMNDDYDTFYASYEEKYNAGMSGTDLENYWQDGILKLFEARTDSIGYLDPVTVSVQVVPEEEEDTIYYSMDENDFSTIDGDIISTDYSTDE